MASSIVAACAGGESARAALLRGWHHLVDRGWRRGRGAQKLTRRSATALTALYARGREKSWRAGKRQ